MDPTQQNDFIELDLSGSSDSRLNTTGPDEAEYLESQEGNDQLDTSYGMDHQLETSRHRLGEASHQMNHLRETSHQMNHLRDSSPGIDDRLVNLSAGLDSSIDEQLDTSLELNNSRLESGLDQDLEADRRIEQQLEASLDEREESADLSLTEEASEQHGTKRSLDDVIDDELESLRPIVAKKNRKEVEEERREKMQVLVSTFTESQLDRYEMYRRAAFPKAAVKRIMQTVTGCSVNPNVVIAMSGVAKLFVGELVEEAMDVLETGGESAPLQPKHLREAVRRMRLNNPLNLPSLRSSRKRFMGH